MSRHIFRKEIDKIFKSTMAHNKKDKELFRLIKNYENDPFILNTQHPRYDPSCNETLLIHALDFDLYHSSLALIENKNVNINVNMGNMNALMFASVRDKDYVKAILKRSDLDSTYESFKTNALMFAVKHSSSEVVNMLLSSNYTFEFNENDDEKSILHVAYYNTNQLHSNTTFESMLKDKYEMINLLMPFEKQPLKITDGENVLECLFRSEYDVDLNVFLPIQIATIQKFIQYFNVDLETIESCYKKASKQEKPDCDEFMQNYIQGLKEKAYLEKNLINNLAKKTVKL